jgi:HTH-type transcriptional regulator / antitoxin HipB
MQKKNKDTTTLDEILDKKYGKRGAAKRKQWEADFKTFQHKVLLEIKTAKHPKLP